jgi:hypothetical protein
MYVMAFSDSYVTVGQDQVDRTDRTDRGVASQANAMYRICQKTSPCQVVLHEMAPGISQSQSMALVTSNQCCSMLAVGS